MHVMTIVNLSPDYPFSGRFSLQLLSFAAGTIDGLGRVRVNISIPRTNLCQARRQLSFPPSYSQVPERTFL